MRRTEEYNSAIAFDKGFRKIMRSHELIKESDAYVLMCPSKAAIKRLDNERLHQFFMGLDPTLYGQIRSQQFQQDPLPSLNRAYNLVLQEERLRAVDVLPEVSEVAAFAMPTENPPIDRRVLRDNERGGRNKLMCSHSCICSSGATAGTVHANAVTTDVAAHTLFSSDRHSGRCNWIIDTGASNHVTGNLSCLQDRENIDGRSVGLPNGQQVVSTLIGSVYVNEFLKLTHVLYVPSLKCNLMSVAQLLSANNYCFEFAKNYCLIQDHSLRTTIGAGELRDGLYWICAGEKSLTVHTVFEKGDFDLWHRRLGHPSDKVTKGDKFAKRGRKCLFVGYPLNQKGWKLYDLDSGTYFVSRDVLFYESEFPLASTHESIPQSDPLLDIFEDPIFDHTPANVTDQPIDTPEPTDTHEPTGPEGLSGTGESTGSAGTGLDTTTATDTGSVATNSGAATDSQVEELGRGHRTKFLNSRLRGFVLDTAHSPSPPSSSPSSPKSPSAVTAGFEPPSFKEVILDSGWCDAMKTEIDALERNDTWELSDLPEGKKALGCRWIYKIKYKADGTVERLKARLVVFGNHQVEGLDYGETFAPVVKMVTIRIFLAIAAINKWELHQMDVHNAFLHDDLDEEVYMKIPPGFSRGKEGKVCRLKKSLYGLRQAPQCWFAKITSSLKSYGFQQFYLDYSLFSYSQDNVWLFILIYVDDLVIAGNDSSAVAQFKTYLANCFHMKDLGPLKYFLGLEVARSAERIYISQRKYALDIIAETGLLGCKPATTPIEQHHGLGSATGPLLEDIESYRRLVGRLVYLAVTRPDLSYVVHILSQFLQQPRQEHMSAALRVVRYLKGSPGQGVLFRADSSISISRWCDSDWGGCPTSRRSVTGWFILLGGSSISWKTKKQPMVSLSSIEAEYRSMANIVCELKWLKGLLLSLDVVVPLPMHVYSDSQLAIGLAHNPVYHERTKHIEIDLSFSPDWNHDPLDEEAIARIDAFLAIPEEERAWPACLGGELLLPGLDLWWQARLSA
ncbi:uncharacterized protein LOC141648605 [Silene latifolia]|uniref:uncharacterized protein LOC141648605 n=1 Tax=Silene latifolia TaxID=37657 RepID=UPI003D77F3B2